MYNKVILIGRLVAAPELHKTSTDKSLARVTVAVNRRYKDQNGERETDFVNVVVWGKLAETMASYASKGSLISLDGEIRTRRYEKNGVMQYVTEVLCQSFQLLESDARKWWNGRFSRYHLRRGRSSFLEIKKESWFVYRPAFLILGRGFIRELLF